MANLPSIVARAIKHPINPDNLLGTLARYAATGHNCVMCNLYRMNRPGEEVAEMLRATALVGANSPTEIWPGYPGTVAVNGALKTMTWGFPRHAVSKRTGKPLKPSPVNNARDDNLQRYPIWRESFRERRCLIPVTQWCEPEGQKGQNTRTWYSLRDQDLFVVAGIWRTTDEWSDAYSMVMVDGCQQMADVHDRMPTVLRPEDWATWADGTLDEAIGLLRTWDGPLVVEKTDEPWSAARVATKPLPTLF